MKKLFALLFACSLLLILNYPVLAQSSVMLNLDIPFQYYIGYNHIASEKINIEGGIGLVVPPFNKWVFTVLPIPVDKDPNRDFARESADWGYIFNIGGNYEIGKNWFAGLFGEYAVLKGSSSVKKVYQSSFKGEVEDALTTVFTDNGVPANQIPILIPQAVGLSSDHAEFESKIYQLGLQFGRTFELKNPQLKLKASLALSRTLSSVTELTSFTYETINLPPPLPPIDTDAVYTEIESELTIILEDETDQVFLDYGYITTLRVGLFYNLSKN